jgi:F0F1-type ATP synthase assembly protein I
MFMPLMLALFARDRVRKGFIVISVIGGPLMVFIFGAWKIFPFDPLFIGLLFTLIVSIIGLIVGKGRKTGPKASRTC